MQVLIVADGVAPYAVGGIQKYSAMLAIWLARVGVPVCLVHAVDDDSKVPAAERLEGFPEDVREAIRSIVIVRPTAGRLPGHYVRDSLKLSERMLAAYTEAGIRSDLIAAQGQTGRAFIRARKRGVALPPVAIHAHGYEMFQSPQGLRGRLEQWLLRPTFARLSKEADFVFSFGGQIRKIVRGLGVPEQRILSARNGIEPEWLLEKPLESDAQKRRFLFVGRYERRKGVEAIHAAIEKIPVSRTEFRFIGPIPPKKRLKRSDVCYDGLVRDSVQLRSIYDTCDILLCPSYSEGMPTVILEA
ncbi:MAG TPA: glycosyltransferase family 4 protein, partial [Opitutales bacterium]|nr:glycosyltransferase family 4 protein [Opitutales bacterium]